ncbi:MAG: hypothetical protein HY738_23225, partial [Bacteroidia bacterium]|nr:hypothetical protein [Bacteroidia bacterium]
CNTTGSVTIGEPTSITLSTSTTNASCGLADGSATVTASGGTGLYSYDWSPNGYSGDSTNTYFNLPGGAYIVTVTDANGCTTTATATVNETSAPSVGITAKTDATCDGGSDGSATVTVFSGNPPFTYVWSNGATTNTTSTTNTVSGLSAGTYNVTVTDAGGCNGVASVAITSPAPITTVFIKINNPLCNGDSNGSATVFPSGGTPSYTFLWLNGDTNDEGNGLNAGTHYVTVTDANGCTAVGSVTLVDPQVLTATITSSANVSCNGLDDGSLTVTANGGTPAYSYNWSPNGYTGDGTPTYSNLVAGVYSVTVLDFNGCSSITGDTIYQPATLIFTTDIINVDCFGNNNGSATIYPVGGTTPYTYLWNDPASQTTQTASNLDGGTYTVTVTDSLACQLITSVTVIEPTAISISDTAISVTCYGQNDGMAIVEANGGTISGDYNYLWDAQTGNQTNDTAFNLPAGTYSVTITDDNGCTEIASVTVNQPDTLIATISSTDNDCYGENQGTANISASGGTNPYNYNWSTGATTQFITNLTAGIYYASVTDIQGCIYFDSVEIIQPAELIISDTTIVLANCGASDGSISVIITGGTVPYSYIWSTSDTSNGISNIAAGIYLLTVTDANNCSIVSNFMVPNATAGIPSITGTIHNRCYGMADGQA